ncbi:hypothetical protein T484DRAFT_3627962 [Baffinella frigidus]|nr:hypothetical protein T484DRAFT_3627962 [Cryptophyta sp. CCMP2293]
MSTNVLQAAFAFISVHAPTKKQYSNINVTIGSSGVLIKRHLSTGNDESATFRDWTINATTRLPKIDTTNPNLLWVALQTGAYEDRWNPNGQTWLQSQGYLKTLVNTDADGFAVHVLDMISPPSSFTTGVCPEDHQDSNDVANRAAGVQDKHRVLCERCPETYTKPIAHLTSCFKTKSTGTTNVQHLRGGFDGSLRLRLC